jgi:hypothetical protein
MLEPLYEKEHLYFTAYRYSIWSLLEKLCSSMWQHTHVPSATYVHSIQTRLPAVWVEDAHTRLPSLT